MTSQKRQLRPSTLLCFLFLFICADTIAQEQRDARQEKSFVIAEDHELEILNKHGDITFEHWDADSLKVVARATVRGRTDKIVQRQIEKLDISIEQAGNYVVAETTFSSDSGILGNAIEATSDFARDLFAADQVEVHYDVFLPNWMEVSIENAYGDLYLGNHIGELDVQLRHGKLKGKNLEQLKRLKVINGDANIDEVGSCRIDAEFSDLRIGSSELLDIDGVASEFRLRNVATLKVRSKHDEYYIERLGEVDGELNSVDMYVDELDGELDLKTRHGDLRFGSISGDFGEISFTSEYTELELEFEEETSLDFNLLLRDSKLIGLDEEVFMISSADEEDDDKEEMLLEGTSSGSSSTGRLRINLSSGELSLSKR